MVVVDLYQVMLAALAVAIMVCVPILCVFGFDVVLKRWLGRREHRREVFALSHQHGLPIEELAADLRRLRAELAHDESRSATHQIGSRLAYDGLLVQACEMLGVYHELSDQTAGMAREIERLRVEAALQSAGLTLIDHRHGQDVP